MGTRDVFRVSYLEELSLVYMHLLKVLFWCNQPAWALGVAEQAKARALSYQLGAGGCNAETCNTFALGYTSDAHMCEGTCNAWWNDVAEMACAEGRACTRGSATCIIEFSFDSENNFLAIWLLSGTGSLLCSSIQVDESLKPGGTIQQLLEEARMSMGVRGCDKCQSSPTEHGKEDDADQDDPSAERKKAECEKCQLYLSQCECEEVLLRKLYQLLIKPIETHLRMAGATELLIIPHHKLWEVFWAGLVDDDGCYLIEHYVIRVASSLRVARQVDDQRCQHYGENPGHVVVVGNPLPIQNVFKSLPCAEQEAIKVQNVLGGANVAVLPENIFLSKHATKTRVKLALKGAHWLHFAGHCDMTTDSLVLAIPSDGSQEDIKNPNLSMHELQDRENAEGVQLSIGATVVLSACDTGRARGGKIKAEGVVGLARNFQLANAAATVVTLCKVSCFTLYASND